MRSSIPNQAIPLSQKNSSWKKRTMDAFLSLSEGSSSKRLRDLGRLYDYYNGVLNPADYMHVTRPYGKERKNFPAKMRNYPIIKSTVDVLLGEKPKRPFNYSVVATNADAVDRREQAMMDLFVNSVSQGVVNNMNSAGLPTGEESKEIPKDLQAMFERTYVDNHAILGQKALTFIVRDQAIREKFCKAWFHFLVAGECFSERTVREDTVCYEILNPLNVSFDLDPDLDYVEDADWCVISRAMGPSAIVRNWGRFLTQDQINGMFTDNRFDPALLGRNSSDQMLTTVRTVYWMSQTRTGFVKYTDETTGEEEEFTVEDGYTLPEELKLMGAKLTWEWHNQPWQGIRIGDNIDVDVRPVTEFRGSMDNPSRVKLPVNGRRYSDINSENISLVMLGVPYQVNYNIYQYRLETAIARSKDIVAQFDINMIPKKWDMDMFMYYVEGTGIAWLDFDKEGVRMSTQHQAVMDLSIKVIGQYIELLEYILRQWELVSGVSAQRRGEVGQYETKSMGQQAIVQSSHVTEDLYRKFAGFEQRDLQALLDCSRKAWVNGKKGVYVMPDGHREFFATDEDYPLSDMGVFVTDASEEVEKFNSARQLAEALVSHGGNLSAALDVLDGGSFAEMREKIRTAERTQQELQAAQEQATQEVEKAKMAQERELADREFHLKEKELQQERELAEADGKLQLRLKEMDLRKPQTNESR